MEHWTPKNQGTGYDLPVILAPLMPIQSKVSVLSGLANKPAKPDGPGDHASGTGAFLTCAHPYKTEGADIKNGISLDQRLAEALGGDTSLRSLQLGMDGGSSAGGCDSGYSCAYSNTLSWRNETTAVPIEDNPRRVFERLFGVHSPLRSTMPNWRAASAVMKVSRSKAASMTSIFCPVWRT